MTSEKVIPFLDQHVLGDKVNFVAEIERPLRNDFFKRLKNVYEDAVIKNGVITYLHNDIKHNIHLVDVGMGKYAVHVHSYFIDFFIGKMLSNMGFTLSPEGLKHTHYYSKTHFLRDVIITTDPEKIFNLLKIDYHAFSDKKNSVEDIFNIVKASPYFDLSYFKEVQVEKPGFIDEFKILIEKGEQDSNPQDATIEDVEKVFPGFTATYEELEKERKEIESAEEKFNGKVFMAKFPEVPQQVLGRTFKTMKSKFENQKAFVEYINKTDLDVILTEFKKTSEELA